MLSPLGCVLFLLETKFPRKTVPPHSLKCPLRAASISTKNTLVLRTMSGPVEDLQMHPEHLETLSG